MIKSIHGKAYGKTIELDEDLGIADGQEVEVRVRLIPSARKWGEGILLSAGGWADYPEMDAIMEQIQHLQKQSDQAREASQAIDQNAIPVTDNYSEFEK